MKLTSVPARTLRNITQLLITRIPPVRRPLAYKLAELANR